MPNFYAASTNSTPQQPQSLFSQFHHQQQQQHRQQQPMSQQSSTNASQQQQHQQQNMESSMRRTSEQTFPQNYPSSSSASSMFRNQLSTIGVSSSHAQPSSIIHSQQTENDRNDRYRNSKSANFITTTTRNATFQNAIDPLGGTAIGEIGKSKSATPGRFEAKGSLILSNSSSNHSNTNSETSVLVHENEKFGDDFHEIDEGFLYLHPSWPVYVYTERGEVFMRGKFFFNIFWKEDNWSSVVY